MQEIPATFALVLCEARRNLKILDREVGDKTLIEEVAVELTKLEVTARQNDRDQPTSVEF